MAYIGKGLVGVLSENKAVDTMSNPNGVLTTMTLSRTPGSVNNVEVYIDGIFQTPGDEFTLAGDVLTFTTAPATNAVVIAVVGNDSTIANVDNNTITGTMFPDGSVTDSKISGINSTKISGTLPALDGSSLTNLTAGNLEGTLPALDGSPLTGVQGFRKNASDPLVNSNGNQGDVWVNTASGEVYVLTDATTNANVWTNVGGGTGNQPFNYTVATGGVVPGGTIDGDYKYHVFNNSSDGPFVVTTAGTVPEVEYLVIAGGGGTKGGVGSGGGAGGFLTGTGFTISAQSYPITVGAGGAFLNSQSSASASNGGNSTFSTITSIGGGGGSDYYSSNPAASGGSGAGGRGNSGGGTTPGSGTVGQGNAGGLGFAGTYYSGGGGGGAGQTGFPAASYTGGDGGDGLQSSITGTATYYSGGGGGGKYDGASTTNNGQGGQGGGGGLQPSATEGDANTGGGAGNAGFWDYNANNYTGSNGGSGIVILRYKFQ